MLQAWAIPGPSRTILHLQHSTSLRHTCTEGSGYCRGAFDATRMYSPHLPTMTRFISIQGQSLPNHLAARCSMEFTLSPGRTFGIFWLHWHEFRPCFNQFEPHLRINNMEIHQNRWYHISESYHHISTHVTSYNFYTISFWGKVHHTQRWSQAERAEKSALQMRPRNLEPGRIGIWFQEIPLIFQSDISFQS